MNEQAFNDWINTLPLEEGDSCIIIVASNEKFGFKVEGRVVDIAAMLLEMGGKTPDFGVALSVAASKLVAKGGAE